MKKLVNFLAVLMLLVTGCDNNSSAAKNNAIETQISPNKIYFFFSDTCRHCHDALAYINKTYPDLSLSMTNVNNPGGYELFLKCAQKFKLGRMLGTPLFCMGDNYLMGWSPEYESKFDEYVRPFVK